MEAANNKLVRRDTGPFDMYAKQPESGHISFVEIKRISYFPNFRILKAP
jgi:hypothetical protein